MKQHLSIIRGTTEKFALTIRDEDDVVYTMSDTESLRFGVKTDPEDTEYIFVMNIAPDAVNDEGAYEFTIRPWQTEDLELGHYYYDVGMQSGDDYYNIIEVSNFIVKPNITKRVVS